MRSVKFRGIEDAENFDWEEYTSTLKPMVKLKSALKSTIKER